MMKSNSPVLLKTMDGVPRDVYNVSVSSDHSPLAVLITAAVLHDPGANPTLHPSLAATMSSVSLWPLVRLAASSISSFRVSLSVRIKFMTSTRQTASFMAISASAQAIGAASTFRRTSQTAWPLRPLVHVQSLGTSTLVKCTSVSGSLYNEDNPERTRNAKLDSGFVSVHMARPN
eukprot:GHVT01067453.1.p1 GENE.GHVT01067453.1~~GHVT01067453.1.p1  ORF type:complete len:175 (-),score=3.37 GHVT01067453.1:789-1313(-)